MGAALCLNKLRILVRGVTPSSISGSGSGAASGSSCSSGSGSGSCSADACRIRNATARTANPWTSKSTLFHPSDTTTHRDVTCVW